MVLLLKNNNLFHFMNRFKKALTLSVSLLLVLSVFYLGMGPSIVKAVADSANVTATVTGEISITSPVDATFSASIPGVTGNQNAPVTASLTWTIKTNNAAGFNMAIHADQANALHLDGSNFFSDHTTAVSYGWTAPGSGAATFGFSPEPATAADTVAAFKDNGSSACGSGSSNTADKCWSGFNGTTDIPIINRTTQTTSAGEAEVVKFQAESYAKYLKSGNYATTVTVTATMN
jgi:hypothetical protein